MLTNDAQSFMQAETLMPMEGFWKPSSKLNIVRNIKPSLPCLPQIRPRRDEAALAASSA
jgi:hypothetical protein